MVDFAVERNLYLHAHCDEEALLILFRHNPKAKIIWAHTGFSVAPARVAELLDEHKDALWGELSYRGGITGGDGKLTSDWRNLFARYSDRFLLGSDTWINERWFGYDTSSRNIADGSPNFRPIKRNGLQAVTRCGCLDCGASRE